MPVILIFFFFFCFFVVFKCIFKEHGSLLLFVKNVHYKNNGCQPFRRKRHPFMLRGCQAAKRGPGQVGWAQHGPPHPSRLSQLGSLPASASTSLPLTGHCLITLPFSNKPSSEVKKETGPRVGKSQAAPWTSGRSEIQCILVLRSVLSCALGRAGSACTWNPSRTLQREPASPF